MLTFTQKITNTAFLIVVCVVLGLIFMPLPNIELITTGVFFAGIWMGPRFGFFIGVVARGLYTLLSPMGVTLPPLLVAETLSMGLVGWTGGLSGNFLIKNCTSSHTKWSVRLYLAAVGAVLVLLYDIFTNIAFALTAGFKAGQIKAWIIMGLPFSIIHITVNVFAFAVLIPIFLYRLMYRRRL